MSLTFKPVYSKRPVLTAAYFVVGADVRPMKPEICIFSKEYGGVCQIRSKGKRERKVGLEHAIYLYGCKTHAVFFPVYPPGWTQYGRRPLVELAPDGSEIDDVPETEDQADVEGADSAGDDGLGDAVEESKWSETAFGAAIDAERGKRWPLTAFEVLQFPEPKPYGVFATQQRHIAGILRLFRIDAASDDKARELVAARLPIGLSALASSAARVRDGPASERWRHDGKEAAAITQTLTPPRRWLKNILELGAAVNFWGSPMYG